MHLKGLKYPLIAAVVIIVLGLLFTGQWTYKKYFLETPLVENINSLPEVEESRFYEETNVLEIKLKEVKNLQKTYTAIKDKLKELKASKYLNIVIIDKRDELLQELFYKSSFAVHQAIAKGDFIYMHDYISKLALEAGIEKFYIFIDNENIYLQFHKGNNYLYEIIKRK
ncbi:MAG: hypothetical protein XD50_1334 [Clostridia bacterium 41_269]|nr:MAG: hypothetical protein XD50_1334 [Clostridia bacterium 41_269]